MKSSYPNPIYNIITFCLFVSVTIITLSTVKSNQISFNDVIKFLPKDYFIKIFFDDVSQTAKLHEVRVPFTLQRCPEFMFRTLNLTLFRKFFHINHLIGPRTRKLMNIVQLRFEKYIRVDLPHRKNRKIHLFSLVRGPGYQGTNTHTIILGNEKLYEMTSKEVRAIHWILGEEWTTKGDLVLTFRNKISLWRVCRIRYARIEFVCVQSPVITEHSLDLKLITGRAWEIEFEEKPGYIPRQLKNRKSHFQTPANHILVSEILLRSNESLARRHNTMGSKIIVQSKSVLPQTTYSFVVLDEFETNFLSCYSTPVLRFDMYIKPFELQLWIALGIILTTISVFIYVYNRNKNLSPSFSPFFFFVSTLFEEPYSVPTALWNNSKFKTITIVWLLTAVIFTNLYTGQMIGDLSVPIRDQALYSFDDVFGFHGTSIVSASSIWESVNFWTFNYTLSEERPLTSFQAMLIFRESGCQGRLDYYNYDTFLQQFRKPDHFALLQP
jgi:hypothetical protein